MWSYGILVRGIELDLLLALLCYGISNHKLSSKLRLGLAFTRLHSPQ
jgi:hypothetical protein